MDRTLDYVIIGVYLITIALLGIFTGGRQRSVKDYFLGSDSISWIAVCFSIVAAETSTLTFISIPGLAYIADLNFLQVTFGYLIGRIIIAKYFLPAYFTGELSTAYSFLENRFGLKTRSYASIVFLITRTAADGVRLFATAIPLKLLLGIDYPLAIIIIAIFALLYTLIGGVKGIIWVDVIQMFIYIGGALIAVSFLIFDYLPNGWDSVNSMINIDDKLSIINLGFNLSFSEFFNTPYTLFSGLIGGAFLSMASHGTDQLIVQRLLATKSLKKAQAAIIGSGVIVILQFALFLILGILLYSFYNGNDLSQLGLLKADEIFPKFIIEKLPVGISGIIIAGLFAAAMSTLAGSISSLSSSTMLDLYLRFKKNVKNQLLISRLFTLFWTIMLIASALFFLNSSQAVVELALSIASFTYGGLLGTFLLGLLIKKATQEDALAGFTAGLFIMIAVIMLKLVAWTWFILIGVSATLIIGGFLSSLSPKKD